jgi:hypothetical protein
MAAQIPFDDHPSPPIEPKTSGGGLSRPLSDGEKRALAMQSANRATAGMAPAAVEKRQAAPAVDQAMKRPRFFSDSIGTDWRRPRSGR